jgi:hypothetical protein
MARQQRKEIVRPEVAAAEAAGGSAALRWATVVAVAVALLALKVAVADSSAGPWFEPDETTYALQGYHVAHGDLSWRHPFRGMGNPGYGMFLAVPWLAAGESTPKFLEAATAANAALTALGVILGYVMLRRWFEHGPSLVGTTAMAIYAPVFIYGFAMLSENLFFPLCLLAILAAQRASATGRWYWWMALAVVTALAAVVRFWGLAGMAAALVAAVWVLVREPRRRNMAPLAAVLLVWGCLVGACYVANIRLMGYSLSGAEVQNIIGDLWRNPSHMSGFVGAFGFGAAYVVLASAALPAAGLVCSVGSVRDLRRALDPAKVFVVLMCLLTLVGYALVTGVSFSQNVDSRLYGRYIDIVAMLVIGYGLAWLASGDLWQRRTVVIAVIAGGLLAAATATLRTENASYTHTFGTYVFLHGGWWWRVGVAGGLAALLVVAAALRRRPLAAGLVIVAALAGNTWAAYSELGDFRQRFEFYNDFGRAVSPILEEHFRAYPDQPRLVYVDKLPLSADVNETNLTRVFGICGMELWTPSVTAYEVTMERRFPPQSLVYSLQPLEEQEAALGLRFTEVYRHRNTVLGLYVTAPLGAKGTEGLISHEDRIR